MKPEQKPTKEVVRTWLHDRLKAKTPPPSREEIRRALGWKFETHENRTR